MILNQDFTRDISMEPQIDELTGEQLKFKNVIIQFAPHNSISGDEVGCIDVNLVGSGEGWYISDGQIVPITWKKTAKESMIDFSTTNGMLDGATRTGQCSDYGVTQFFTEDGEKLKMNPGNSFP